MLSYAECQAMKQWYVHQDLRGLKNWLYVRSKLEYILTQAPYNEAINPVAHEYRALHGWFYLISDNAELIDWYSNIDQMFDARRTGNPRMFDFWTEQFFIALRGEWSLLADRCERILSSPPKSGRERKFMIDHQFYLSLARETRVLWKQRLPNWCRQR